MMAELGQYVSEVSLCSKFVNDLNPSLPEQQQALEQEIAQLQATKAQLQHQLAQTQQSLGQLVQDSLSDLQQRKQALQTSIEQLERRQERVQQEMRQNFAGVSQDLAVRVQGFKDYLVNSLQDLVTTTEQLNLLPAQAPAPKAAKSRADKSSEDLDTSRERRSSRRSEAEPKAEASEAKPSAKPQFSQQEFDEEMRQIRRLLEQYRFSPNYYGPPWQLRRTFEPIHAERVNDWFFTLGGRGALRSLNSRLQNILVAAAITSVLYHLYGGALKVMILADSPERLGDWRRGFQDCLGLTRNDFSPEGGITLYESAESLSFRADRYLRDDFVPLILVDDSETTISLAILQFPLFLAFAPVPQVRPARGLLDFFE
jgi:Protein of unknown function (DUF3086)